MTELDEWDQVDRVELVEDWLTVFWKDGREPERTFKVSKDDREGLGTLIMWDVFGRRTDQMPCRCMLDAEWHEGTLQWHVMHNVGMMDDPALFLQEVLDEYERSKKMSRRHQA